MATAVRDRIALLFVWALTVSAAHAQAVNPTHLSFYPSADHDVVDLDGRAVVARYGVQLYEYGSGQALLRVNLGKPRPGADGAIEIDLRSVFPSGLLAGTVLDARIVAIGPGGSSESVPSNPFVFEWQQAPSPGNAPPSVQMMAPTDRAAVPFSLSIPLTATADDADGAIAWVAFYVDGRLVAAAVDKPYIGWWFGATPGTHALVVLAVDNGGAYTRAPAIGVTVAAPRVVPPESKPAGKATPRPPTIPRGPGQTSLD